MHLLSSTGMTHQLQYGIRTFHSSSRHASEEHRNTSQSHSISSKPQLTHLTPSSTVKMVTLDSSKAVTSRVATATCNLHFSNLETAELVRTASLKKGDVLSVARIAGIMAAKKTADLIPLCHNIPLSGCDVEVLVVKDSTNGQYASGGDESPSENDFGKNGGVKITATVKTNGQTGVEMEALTAASAASLTVYDMCKAVDKSMRIDGLRVVLKDGGRTGRWVERARDESSSPTS